MIKRFKNSIVAQISTLGIFAVIFFHELFRMEFWKDDYALLYMIQQKISFFYPYQHFVSMHMPLYGTFGLNPLGYFITGLLIIFASTVVFYFLVYELFSKKILAFMASLIYLTSPIGIDDIFMMTTFLTGYLVLFFFLLALLFLCKFHKRRKIIYYLISTLVLILAFELLPHRTFYYPFVLFLFEVIYFERRKGHFKGFIVRQFVLLSMLIFFFYVSPIVLYPDPTRNHVGNMMFRFQDVFNYHLLLNPLLTSVNMIYAGFAHLLYQNFYFYNIWIGLLLLIFTLVCFIYLIFRFRKKEQYLVKTFIFSIGYLYLTPLAFYVFSNKEISIASFRYLHPGLPAYGLLIICIYLFLCKIFKSKKGISKFFPILLIIALVFLINSCASQLYIKDFNSRSPYTRQFINQLTGFVPKLPKNSVIYFNLDEDANVNFRLIDSYRVGRFDERACFAVRYGMKMEELSTTVDYSILLNTVKANSIDKNNIFAFKYRENGLTDITNNIRETVSRDLEKAK